MAKIITIILFMIYPALASAYEYRYLIAIAVAMETNNNPVPPSPTPVPPTPVPPTPITTICDNCNGTGKLGDGTISITCPACEGTGKRKIVENNYNRARQEAIDRGKNLIVFIGIDPIDLNETITIQADKFGNVTNGIVISRNRGDWLEWVTTLPITATKEEIQQALRESNAAEEVGGSVPFRRLNPPAFRKVQGW